MSTRGSAKNDGQNVVTEKPYHPGHGMGVGLVCANTKGSGHRSSSIIPLPSEQRYRIEFGSIGPGSSGQSIGFKSPVK